MEDKPCTSRDAGETSRPLEDKNLKKKPTGGGKYCCVPQCTNSSIRNPELSFYQIPKGKELKRKWHKILKTKGLLNIKQYYRVCSVHFPGGKKSYMHNIPTTFTGASVTCKPRNIVVRNTSPETDVQATNNISSPLSNELDTSKSIHPTTLEHGDEHDEIDKLKEQIQSLESKCEFLEKTHEAYVSSSQQCLFRLERFLGSDCDFRFYTGFPDYATFKIFFDYLTPACCNLIYYGSNTAEINSADQKKSGKQRSLSPEQELFMVLSRLRCGFLQQDLAHRFGISCMHVSRIWITWLTFLHQRLRALSIWPTRQFLDDNMPLCFKQNFPQTRVIIDCTEIMIEMPSSCRSQSATFSSYKNHNTAKGLLGISPHGYPSFVSNLYAGRTSDKKITKDCGILNLLEPGDQIMADRGFDIEEDLPPNVTLNIPPFLNEKDQLSLEEEVKTRKIASVRVHVERAIARIKNFRILHQVVPITVAKDLDKIWGVCSYITLFLPPIIVEKANAE